jgi:5-methylcytosine-specific restriction endonuclease McrA
MAWESGSKRRQARSQNNTALHHRVVRANPVCQCSGCVACVPADGLGPCGQASTECDHIVPFAEGGKDERSNLQAMCHHCHARKTSAEALRGKARRRTPGPNDGLHPGLLAPPD